VVIFVLEDVRQIVRCVLMQLLVQHVPQVTSRQEVAHAQAVQQIVIHALMEILVHCVTLCFISTKPNVLVLALSRLMFLDQAVHLVLQIVIIVIVMEVLVHNAAQAFIYMVESVMMIALSRLMKTALTVKIVQMIVMYVQMAIPVQIVAPRFIYMMENAMMIVL